MQLLLLAIVCLTASVQESISATIPSTLRSALLAGGWRSTAELNRMSLEDKRNTLIVEMSKHSSESIPTLQGYNNEKLVYMAGVALFLMEQGYRTKQELKGMSYEDQRNTLIVELHNRLDNVIPDLQSKSNKELLEYGASMADDGRTIEAVIDLTWRIDEGKRVGARPEILHQQTYDNCNSKFDLTSTFSYTKTVSETTTFETTDAVNYKFGASTTFKAGLPLVGESETTLSFEIGGEHTWTNGKTDTISRTYKKTIAVSVPPGQRAVRKSTMTIQKINVPYTMKVKTKLGTERVINGVWKGVSLMSSTDSQHNQPC